MTHRQSTLNFLRAKAKALKNWVLVYLMSDEVQKSLLIVGLFYLFFTTHFCGKTRLTGCGYIGEKDTGKDEKENRNELWNGRWRKNAKLWKWVMGEKRQKGKQTNRKSGKGIMEKERVEKGHGHNWDHSSWDSLRCRCYVPSIHWASGSLSGWW